MPNSTLSKFLLALMLTTLVPAGAPAEASSVRNDLVVVDGSVQDTSFFLEHALPGVRTVVLDPAQDGVSQMSTLLARESGLTSLHIVSHGDEGRILLGKDWLDRDALVSKAAAVSGWKHAFAPQGQIDLYGCDVAAGDGAAFVRTLAILTEADVAASDDTTGQGGDWDLEVVTRGAVHAAFGAGLAEYPYALNHFRYGTMSYSLVSGRTVLIKIDNDWTNNHGFIPSNTAIGGVVNNAFTLNFGDGNTQSVTLRVTSRDAANNDVQTEAVTLSGATYVTGIRHTYATDGNYTPFWTSSARESASSQTNSTWRSEMKVNIGNGNSSPVAAVPAVVQVQDNTIFRYSLVAVDPNGDTVQFRLGTQQEFYGNNSSSSVTPPTGMTVSSTGAIVWDVRNGTLSTSAGARWQMTVMVEDLTSTGAVKSKVPIDFVFVISNNAPPRFVSYPTGTQAAPANSLKTVTLVATDPNWLSNYASPTITALNPPSTNASVWTGSVLRASSGATYTASFTPTSDMVGQTFVVIFRATNSSGATAVQPVTFLVPGANQAPSNVSLSNDNIVEHSPAGSVIGTLTATDIDPGDSHTFALTGATDTGIFSIVGNQLRLASSTLSNSGTYTVTVRATDSGSLFLDKSFTVRLWLDVDEDLIADYHDSLIGVASYVTTAGMTDFQVRVGGNTASGTYANGADTAFYDGSTELVVFTSPYDSNTLHLANVVVKRETHALVVNMGGELPPGTMKTLYLDDDNFVSLCVKDASITSVSEITDGCAGVGEIDFSACIGDPAGVTISGVTCYDEGTRFRVENLSHSGIIGKQAASAPAAQSTSGGSSGGSSGGGGGGGSGRRNVSLGSTYGAASSEAVSSSAPAESDCGTSSFTDVQVTSWYMPHVCVLYRNGVVSGYRGHAGDDLHVYRPNTNVSYAELAKMALLASKHNVKDGESQNPSAKGDWSASFIHAMEALGVSVYTSPLNVHAAATRGEVAQVIMETFGFSFPPASESQFSDLKVGELHANALLNAVAMGIMQGDTAADGTLLYTIRPNAPINRAETAKIFHLLLQYVASH